jgi:hypothetical protein
MHHAAFIRLTPPAGVTHGIHPKDMFVSHETVSYNLPGLRDVEGIENVLKGEGYWIHGITDMEAHRAWNKGHGNAVFYHAGGVNERAVGCENISEIPILILAKKITNVQAHDMWMKRDHQLNALAMMIACWHNADKKEHPLIRSNGNSPGVCSHWDVSQHHKESEGHWDCRPFDKGGHFPLAHTIALAKHLALSYEF